jgi:capsular polysaccharide transport system permease protein
MSIVNKCFRKLRLAANKSLMFIKRKRLFFMVVFLPLAIGFYYDVFWRTPIFESSARIMLLEQGGQSAPDTLLASLTTKYAVNINKTVLIKEYLSSFEMLKALDSALDIKSHFQAKKIDFISRLKHNAKQKEVLTYFKKKISVTIEPQTNELNLRVYAFNPVFAQLMAKKIIQLTKVYLDDVVDRLTKKKHAIAKMRLIQMEKSLVDINKTLVEAKNNQSLKGRGDSVVLDSKIEWLGVKLSMAKADYLEARKINESLSQTIALQKNMIVLMVSPTLPDSFDAPNVKYDIINLLAVLMVLFLIIKMGVIIIEDHVD